MGRQHDGGLCHCECSLWSLQFENDSLPFRIAACVPMRSLPAFGSSACLRRRSHPYADGTEALQRAAGYVVSLLRGSAGMGAGRAAVLFARCCATESLHSCEHPFDCVQCTHMLYAAV